MENFSRKMRIFQKNIPFQKKSLHISNGKILHQKNVDRHTEVNPSCYLVLSFKVFPHILQLELERIKTFKLQKTSPQKLTKEYLKVGAKSSS
jgi:hypothetical protein